MAKEIKVRFNHDKSTKGAHRYNEVGSNGKTLTTNDPDCVIGTLYLRKSAVGDEPVKTWEITLKAV